MNSNALYTVEHDGIYNVDVKFSPELADFNDWKPLSSMLLPMIECMPLTMVVYVTT